MITTQKDEGSDFMLKDKNKKASVKLIKKTDNSYQQEIKDIIDIISRKGRKRNLIENTRLLTFLQTTNFEREFQEDFIIGSVNLQTLFFFFSQFMECRKFHKGEIIYYEGSIGENIYLILTGKVTLYKLTFEESMSTPSEYYLFLMSFRENKNSKFLLVKTIEENKNVLPLNAIEDLLQIDEIIFKIKLLQLRNNNDIEKVKGYFTQTFRKPEDYGFDRVINEDITLENYFDGLLSKMTNAEKFYSKYINDTKVPIKKAKYTTSQNVSCKEYFGMFKLGDYANKRTETAITEEEAIIILINKKMYSSCILSEKRNIKEKEIDILHQGTFFNLMRRNTFTKYFFYELELVDLVKGEYIYKEGDPLDYIYFIKEGTFQLSLNNKSILDIKELIAQIQEIEPLFKKAQYDDMCKLKNNLNILLPYLKVKTKFDLFVVNKGTFGILEFYYKTKIFMNIKVISDKSKCYRLKVSKLQREGMEDLFLLQRGMKKECFDKVKIIYERLLMLKNSSIMKIDIECTNRRKEEMENYYNQQKSPPQKNLVSFIKSSFNLNPHQRKSRNSKRNISLGNLDEFNKLNKIKGNEIFLTANNNNIKNNNSNRMLFHYMHTNPTKPKEEKTKSLKKNRINYSIENEYLKKAMNMASLETIKSDEGIVNRVKVNSEVKNDYFSPSKNTLILPRIFSNKILKGHSYSEKKKKYNVRLKDLKEREVFVNGNAFLDELDDENKKNLNYLAVRKFYNDLKIRK